MSELNSVKYIAFHLPQFHEIPENNHWWGRGFTEWTKVRSAVPLFKGHQQPRVPKDECYYDLSDHSQLCRQAELAQHFGVGGFCFYHYWFKGKRLLETPLEMMLSRKSPNFPFMLAWANEPWTRAWNEGGEREILQPQEYGDNEDWLEHIRCLLRYFKDERYIKLNNKPVLLLYRPESIENFDEMIQNWEIEVQKAGFDGIHLVRMLTVYSNKKWANSRIEANVEFEPGFTIAHTLSAQQRFHRKLKRLGMKLSKNMPLKFRKNFITRFDYTTLSRHISDRVLRFSCPTYPGVFVAWDNTPRRKENGIVVDDSTPSIFEDFLGKQTKKALANGLPFVFINAWKEWAEGAYLEPDVTNDTQYLEALERVVRKY